VLGLGCTPDDPDPAAHCLPSCDGNADCEQACADGEAAFSEPVEDGNAYSCATCHAIDEPSPDGFRRPGHPVGDAAARPHYKNGQVDELREAVNACLEDWMGAQPWDGDDARWLALEGWLQSHAPAEAQALTIEIVDPPAALDGGDSTVGRDTFNATCAQCHGHDGVGGSLAPSIGVIVDPALTAERIRRAGPADSPHYEGLLGGRMPFWAADRLGDDELRDILAFLSDPP
jgi:cytochrome c